MNSRDDDHENNGLPVIVAAYEQHKDNSEVVETIVALLKELVSYSESSSSLHFSKFNNNNNNWFPFHAIFPIRRSTPCYDYTTLSQI